MGILLVRRAIIVTPQPSVVIVAGCVLTALVVAGDHGLGEYEQARAWEPILFAESLHLSCVNERNRCRGWSRECKVYEAFLTRCSRERCFSLICSIETVL